MKKIVGLNVDVNVQKPTDLRIAITYCEAIEKSGGIPMLLPPMSRASLEQALDRIDRLVLIGGRDYNPELYGEQKCAEIAPLDERRQRFDMLLARSALRRHRLPILGICGGMQLLNIALGGTLWQDIPSQIQANASGEHIVHRGHNHVADHPVSLIPGTKLARIYRTTRLPKVITAHHQCLKKLGQGLIMNALADDGITEGVEMPARPFVIGVQYHPEKGYEENVRLFRALILQPELD